MLMFGNEYDIVRHFPEYFLDYREEMDSAIRWTDRLQSSSGEWSGNVCDFYFRVYNKIMQGLASLSRDGIDSVRSVIKELEHHGYVQRNIVRNEYGCEIILTSLQNWIM